jgi:RNA polymerase sigma factor (sigma-70 family)
VLEQGRSSFFFPDKELFFPLLHLRVYMAAIPEHTHLWIEEAQRGDTAALERLLRVWHPKIYQFALKYFGRRSDSREMAQEVAQESALSLCRNMATLRDPAKFRPWIYQIAVNHCNSLLRKGQKSEASVDVEHIQLPATQASGDELAQQQHWGSLLQKAMNGLPENQRTVVIMKEYEGLTFREIAETLQISENTAKSRLYYALEHLRRTLEVWNVPNDLRI